MHRGPYTIFLMPLFMRNWSPGLYPFGLLYLGFLYISGDRVVRVRLRVPLIRFLLQTKKLRVSYARILMSLSLGNLIFQLRMWMVVF